MIPIVASFLIWSGLVSPVRSFSLHPTIDGIWIFNGYIYQGKRVDRPNPELIVRFDFATDLTSHLIWFRENEKGFCERRGVYEIRGEYLYQRITWVNSKNNGDCAQDSDMQLGRESETKFAQPDLSELQLFFQINDQPLIYILSRCVPGMTDCLKHPPNFRPIGH